MTNDLKNHLRAALDAAVSEEKARLHAFYDKHDAEHRARVTKLQPLLLTLTELKNETQGKKGVSISVAEHGHMGSVKLKSGSSSRWLTLSTNSSNSHFTVEEKEYWSFGDGGESEKTHKFANADEALALIVAALGKHIASNEVLSERRK